MFGEVYFSLAAAFLLQFFHKSKTLLSGLKIGMRSKHGKMFSQPHFDEGLTAHLDIEVSSDAFDDFLLHLVEGWLRELGSWCQLEYIRKDGDDSVESNTAF